MRKNWLLGLMIVGAGGMGWGAPLYEAQFVAEPVEGVHMHASCIVECPNGDLRAVWYENGPKMPAPYPESEKDKSADVRIGGSRKAKGATGWEPRFVTADNYGVSDNNPCMVIDREQRLWLFFPSLLAVPQEAWGSSFINYKISSDYEKPGVPKWDEERVLIIHPRDLGPVIEAGAKRYAEMAAARMAQATPEQKQQLEERVKRFQEQAKDIFNLRLGWMCRAHPLILSDGALLLPVANENFNIASFLFTRDGGKTWTISEPVPEAGILQPSVVELADKSLMAYFRNSTKRIRYSESHDGGMTWSGLKDTSLPHPGSGIEAVLLKNGHLAMVYNDKEDNPRDSLAISISDDLGKTWKWTRHLEKTPDGRFDYPSLIQAKDGTLHVTYSVDTRSIKYAHFNEEWVQEGD